MKHIVKVATLIVLAVLSLSCAKEDVSDVQNEQIVGSEFTIRLIQTKTVTNGQGTEWVAGDKVNVFHAEAGTQNFISDGPFEFTGDNSFKGFIRDGSVESGKKYDWYVLYPYDENMASPKAAPIYIPADQYQSKDDDMTHVAGPSCPFAGKATEVASNSAIVVNMKHLVTVLKIKVTNYEPNPMPLELVSFRADGLTHVNEDVIINNGDPATIAGSFEVDITGDKFVYNQVKGTSRPLLHLNTPKTLGLNESATVYMVTIPFHVPNASTLTVGMNNNSGGVTQGIYGKNVDFKAGFICSVRQGSRLAPPFKDGINFYCGKKNENGTYEFDEGRWRCDLPVDFQFSGEFNFADLFYTCNTGDAKIKMVSAGNQNDRGGNGNEARFNELSACCQGFSWVANRRWDNNFNVNYSDKSGLFLDCYAGYKVGSWLIWFRIEDPFEDLIKAVDGDILLETTPTINGGALWGNKFFAPTAVYGPIAAGTEVNICAFLNANPGSWDQERFNLFYPNWKAITVTATNGELLLHNDGQNLVLTEYAKKLCKQSSGLTWVPAWYRGFDRTSGLEGEYTEEGQWSGGVNDSGPIPGAAEAAAKHGISITPDGRLVLSADYDGFGFRFAPSLTFEYDYGYAQHVGTKYLPFVVCNI